MPVHVCARFNGHRKPLAQWVCTSVLARPRRPGRAVFALRGSKSATVPVALAAWVHIHLVHSVLTYTRTSTTQTLLPCACAEDVKKEIMISFPLDAMCTEHNKFPGVLFWRVHIVRAQLACVCCVLLLFAFVTAPLERPAQISLSLPLSLGAAKLFDYDDTHTHFMLCSA